MAPNVAVPRYLGLEPATADGTGGGPEKSGDVSGGEEMCQEVRTLRDTGDGGEDFVRDGGDFGRDIAVDTGACVRMAGGSGAVDTGACVRMTGGSGAVDTGACVRMTGGSGAVDTGACVRMAGESGTVDTGACVRMTGGDGGERMEAVSVNPRTVRGRWSVSAVLEGLIHGW